MTQKIDFYNEKETIKKGSMVVLTYGIYEDYIVKCLCRALKDINRHDIKEEYLKVFPRSKDMDGVIRWLINETNYLEKIDSFELYLGSYWIFDEEPEDDSPAVADYVLSEEGKKLFRTSYSVSKAMADGDVYIVVGNLENS